MNLMDKTRDAAKNLPPHRTIPTLKHDQRRISTVLRLRNPGHGGLMVPTAWELEALTCLCYSWMGFKSIIPCFSEQGHRGGKDVHVARTHQALSSNMVEHRKKEMNLTSVPTPVNLDTRNGDIWRVPGIWGPGNSRESQRKSHLYRWMYPSVQWKQFERMPSVKNEFSERQICNNQSPRKQVLSHFSKWPTPQTSKIHISQYLLEIYIFQLFYMVSIKVSWHTLVFRNGFFSLLILIFKWFEWKLNFKLYFQWILFMGLLDFAQFFLKLMYFS